MSDEDAWLQETLIEFLRGPCYTNPLMGFIDEKCVIFDDDEENKLEYTQVHEQFKEVVDELISDFLEEIGVTHEQFFETVANNLDNNNINSFVVSSILTVEDFIQFKAMMVKRNIDLTNQVLSAIEEEHITKIMQAHANYMNEVKKLEGLTYEEMLQEALTLSGRQTGGIDDEIAQALRNSKLDEDGAEYDNDFKAALSMSMKEQSALDLEKAELEQALALSLALEQEQQRLAAQWEAASAAQAAAAPAASAPAAAAWAASPPFAAAAPIPAAAGAPTLAPLAAAAPTSTPPAGAPSAAAPAAPVSQAAAAKTQVPDLQPLISGRPAPTPPALVPSPAMAPLVPVSAHDEALQSGSGLPSADSLPSVGVASKVLRGAAGYNSGDTQPPFKTGTSSLADFQSIREAAGQAAKAQKEMLLQRKQDIKEKKAAAAEVAGSVDEAERKKREAYLKRQRELLLEMQKQKREEELEQYKMQHKLAPRPGPASKEEEMEAKRAELRNSLAQRIKQQMIAKQAEMSSAQ